MSLPQGQLRCDCGQKRARRGRGVSGNLWIVLDSAEMLCGADLWNCVRVLRAARKKSVFSLPGPFDVVLEGSSACGDASAPAAVAFGNCTSLTLPPRYRPHGSPLRIAAVRGGVLRYLEWHTSEKPRV